MQPPDSFPAAAESFKLEDAASYDDVADDFERFTERFTAPIAAKIIDLAALAPGAEVLDVGCGTGVITRLAAERVGDSGRVIGIDLSDGMLRKASELADAARVGKRIEFRKADAEQLAFPDASFASVLSLYALKHFPNPVRALREMFRVARPGSRTIVAVGSGPAFLSTDFVTVGCRFVFEKVQSLFGRGPLYATSFLDGLLDQRLGPAAHAHDTAWAHAHGSEGSSASVPEMMRVVGYTDVRSTWVGQTSVIESAEDFWTLQVTLSSRARRSLPSVTEPTLRSLKHEFDEICAGHLRRGGKLIYRSGALISIGTRPT